MSTALFQNIPKDPKEDYLNIFETGTPNYHKVIEILGFQNKEVAKAASVPPDSVRYDKKMPKDLEDRITEWAIAISAVGRYFKDISKTQLWFKIPNPLLGNVAPRDMIRVGRFAKLYRFIQNALKENTR